MCTGIRLRCADGSVVAGRTVEFAVPITMDAIHVPAGTLSTSPLASGPGASWNAEHAAIGVAAFGTDSIMDGFNDAGLTAAAFYFTGWAEYAPAADTPAARSVNPADLVHWLLTNCATVADVRARIADVSVVDTTVDGWGPTAPPFHYLVLDADGTAIVIEPRGGALVVTDNPYGSMANAPDFQYHLTNLGQYLEVRPDGSLSAQFGDHTVRGFGAGAGGLGLPGDFTSPSRFIRATFFSANHETPADAPAGIQEVFHILNQFDIPRGAVTGELDGTPTIEWTLATVARSPGTGDYYFRTYGDQTIRKVNLKALRGSSGITRLDAGPITGAMTPVDDVTGEMQASPTA